MTGFAVLREVARIVVASDPEALSGRKRHLCYMAVARTRGRYGARAISDPADGQPHQHSGWKSRYNLTAEAIGELAARARMEGHRNAIMSGSWSSPKSATLRAAFRTKARRDVAIAVAYFEGIGLGDLARRLAKRMGRTRPESQA